MFVALLLFALACLLFGFFTSLKWLFIIAVVLFLVSLVTGSRTGYKFRR